MAEQLHLTSWWRVKPACWDDAVAAVRAMAREVLENEPGTLSYIVHVPMAREEAERSKLLSPGLRVTEPHVLTFVEIYQDDAAFHKHVAGDIFQKFVATHGHLFEEAAGGGPDSTVSFYRQAAGTHVGSKL